MNLEFDSFTYVVDGKEIVYNGTEIVDITMKEGGAINGTVRNTNHLPLEILESSPRKAKIEFELCQRSIISCLEKDNASYQFLLEGFHAHYFLDICKKWLKKIKN